MTHEEVHCITGESVELDNLCNETRETGIEMI